VTGWLLIRVITIRHRAWLASRLPPGLSRWRVTFPRRGRDRGGRAQVRPGGLRAQPLRVVPGRDQQQRGGIGADAVQGKQDRGAGSDEGNDELVQAIGLPVEELCAPPQLPQRDAGGVADGAARAGPQRRHAADQGGDGMLGEPRPQIIGAGHD
jgi:hypothetical protein